ncbi:MAG: glycosyltransferase family 39 protein [Anaerolineales bacterium]|nr:glycosyltransferase family 39 protein [Anaerolineales bacterium]
MKRWAGAVTLLLVGWGLLSWQLAGRSLWFDEYLSLQMSRGSPAQVVAAAAGDIHPPLYFLGLAGWTTLAGVSDFALRWFSAAAGLLSVALGAALARRWLGPRAALPAALLMAFAPPLVEFSRMARYYALLVALALLATLLLLRAARRPTLGRWLLYAAAGLALVSTFYPAALLFAAHGLWLRWPGALPGGRPRRTWRGWMAAVAGTVLVAAALYGPTVLARASTISRAGGADLARSGLGLALGVAFTGYTFAVGETLFPWNPFAWVGLAAVAALLFVGIRRRARGLWPALAGLGLCAAGVALVTTFVSVNTPFINVPVRGVFAWPLFGLALAAGLPAAPRRVAAPLLAALALTWGAGLVNYYGGQQFLNPIYLTPAREAAAWLAAAASPGDALLIETDSLVGYYLAQPPATRASVDAANPAAVAAALAAAPVRVWLVALGRDQTAAGSPAEAIRAALAADYRLSATERWQPLDAAYVRYKEMLLRRPTYTYRLTIETYTRRGSP